MNRIIKAAAIAAIAGVGVIGTTGAANAATITKTETITVVDKPAWTEYDVTVVDQPAWTETVVPAKAAVWAYFNPTNPKKFTGTPTYPTDPRGTWIEGVMPDGHKGADGVYQKGGGNGTWFYRHAMVPATTIEHAAVTHIEDVQHPAETHEETITTVLTDTNDPVASFDPKTGSGVVVKDDTTGEAPTFDLTWTVNTDNYWEAYDGLDDGDGDIYRHRRTQTIYDVVADVTPIVGDETGQVLGWNVTPRIRDEHGNYDATQTSFKAWGDPFWFHVTAPYGNYASNDGGTFVLTATNPSA